MFEAKLFGTDVQLSHLILVVIVLSALITAMLYRVTRPSVVATVAVSIVATQAIAGALLILARSKTAQPVHDAQTWIAHYLTAFNLIIFWLLCPIFTAPAAVIVALVLNRRR